MAGLRGTDQRRRRHPARGPRRPRSRTACRLWSEGESRTLKELTQPAIAAADLAPLLQARPAATPTPTPSALCRG